MNGIAPSGAPGDGEESLDWETTGISDEDFLNIDMNCACSSQQSSSTSTTPAASPMKTDEGKRLNFAGQITPQKRIKSCSSESNFSTSPAASLASPNRSSPFSSPTTTSPKSRAQIYKVKNGRSRREGIPLQVYRYGRVWVSDIMSQLWCEQQMVYRFDPPPEMLEVPIIEPPEVQAGADMHMARELEIQDVVEVRVTSAEDRLALKIITLMDAIRSLLQLGMPMRREIPVFGMPFGLGVFVVGVIDEVRCDPDTMQLDLVEFKTRATNALPTAAQRFTHVLQVMLYKRLFDDMVRGVVTKRDIATHMHVDLRKPFGNEMLQYVAMHDHSAMSLDRLLDGMFELMAAVPYVSDVLTIEYAFQPDGSTIGETRVDYEEAWLHERLRQAFQFWTGERRATGVDIEDLWKCQRCPYSSACDWRKRTTRAHFARKSAAARALSLVEDEAADVIDCADRIPAIVGADVAEVDVIGGVDRIPSIDGVDVTETVKSTLLPVALNATDGNQMDATTSGVSDDDNVVIIREVDLVSPIIA